MNAVKYIKSFIDSFNGKGYGKNINLYDQSKISFLDNHIFISSSKDLFEIGLINKDESVGHSILIGRHPVSREWFVE